jgi:tetratricopeptide (TPR) repeat protein
MSGLRLFRLTAGVVLVLSVSACSVRRVETAKSLYDSARRAQSEGNDTRSVVMWKAVMAKADREIQEGHFPNTAYFIRASARLELGQWDAAFEDLKNVSPESLTADEVWIAPLYSILMGDYYSHSDMFSVAAGFYQSVLKKSTWKSSPAYLLALERKVNNSVRMIETRAEQQKDPDKFRTREYGSVLSELRKYLEDHPGSSVPHFLVADLLLKTGQPEEAMEHLVAACEMGLPTRDLRKSAEYRMAEILANHQIPLELRRTLLRKAVLWWPAGGALSAFRAGVESVQTLGAREAVFYQPIADGLSGETKIRYLAVVDEAGKWRILAWEEAQ